MAVNGNGIPRFKAVNSERGKGSFLRLRAHRLKNAKLVYRASYLCLRA